MAALLFDHALERTFTKSTKRPAEAQTIFNVPTNSTAQATPLKVVCLGCSKVAGFMMRPAGRLHANSVRRTPTQGCMASDGVLPGSLDDASCISGAGIRFHAFQTVNFHTSVANRSEALLKQTVPVCSFGPIFAHYRATLLRGLGNNVIGCRTAAKQICSEKGRLLPTEAQLRLNAQVFDREATWYFQHFIQWLSARPRCAGCACQGWMDVGSLAPAVVARLVPKTCATGVCQQ